METERYSYDADTLRRALGEFERATGSTPTSSTRCT